MVEEVVPLDFEEVEAVSLLLVLEVEVEAVEEDLPFVFELEAVDLSEDVFDLLLEVEAVSRLLDELFDFDLAARAARSLAVARLDTSTSFRLGFEEDGL